MKKVTAILALMTMFFMANSQVSNWVEGTVCSTCIVNSNNASNPKGGGNNQIMNGNGIVVNNYTHTACGLGYVQASKD
ncbi:MAG: hypothetical protein IPI93_00735 [Sphingobacteriaceae bacterium]|nr:hypothetical protein [Sphingobacteriaceae bacterium]